VITFMIQKGVRVINIVYPSKVAYLLLHRYVRKVLDRFFRKNRALLRFHSFRVIFSHR
jgi:hypothetical protein